MSFIDRLVARIAIHIFDKAWTIVETRIETLMDYQSIYQKHNDKKNEMALELAQATTDEERDAILTKIYNSRPVFK